MQKLFKHIRQQPKNVRENYALGVASIFTTLVVFVWIMSQPKVGALGEVSSKVSETAAPFATLIKESKEQLAQLRGAAVTATSTEQASSTPEIVPGADALILTPEDISIANDAATEGVAAEPRAYVEVQIGTSSATLPPIQNTVSSSTPITL